jgi:NDP-sugar pyrophosphorylase family protein
MALRPAPDWEAIGPVLADERGQVRRITSLVGEGGLPGTHFTGVHALSRDALDRIPDGFQCVVRTAYLELVAEGRVASTMHRGTWVDVGTPEAYLEANLAVLDGRVVTPLDPWAHGCRGDGQVFIGEGARIEGDVRHSVVGPRAVVLPGARLRDCVVWDGAEVPAGDYERCIFYDQGGVLGLPEAPAS